MNIYSFIAAMLISGTVSTILVAGLYLSGRSSNSYEDLEEMGKIGNSPLFHKVPVIRKQGELILFKSINNTGKSNFTIIRNREESQVFNSCRQQIGDLVYDYVSVLFQNGVLTVYLYRDEIMNDDLISKIQDELYPRNCDVKVIYNWKSN